MTFAELIKDALDAGVTVDEIAEHMECARSTVDRWLRAASTPHPLIQASLARHLNGLKENMGSRSW